MPSETYYYATGTEITEIADAVREKGDVTGPIIFPDGFVNAIESIHYINYFTGTSAPSNQLGNNGDIYLQIEE